MNQKQIAKIILLSNYFSHHQKPFSDEMFAVLDDGYLFIETATMDSERKNLGWGIKEQPTYVVTEKELQRNLKSYQEQINDADVVIVGSAPDYLIAQRKKEKKVIFRYSERQLKKGTEPLKYLYRFIKWQWKNTPHRNIYMLCASGYTAADYAKFGLFKNRCYKWGYFPAVHHYDEGELFARKNGAIPTFLWAGRFIDWKHPDDALAVAARLKQEGVAFQMNMIGTGEMEQQLQEFVARQGLGDCVHLLGAMKPEQVREHMEQANIYLFTSDRGEGWGAVLNESMNSGCAVVASHAIGAVPFLMKDGENGLIYESGNVDMLCKKVKWLLEHPEEQKRMGHNAYRTMADTWNAKEAVRRLLLLIQDIQTNGFSERFDDGPCSRAQRIPDAWWG